MNKNPLIGAHMSIAGGVYNAILHAEAAGCRTVQLFNKSNNQWRAKRLTAEEIDRFHEEVCRTGIAPQVSHTSYLINCGSPSDELYHKSLASLRVEYERCCLLGIDALVMHPGAHTGSGVEVASRRIAAALNDVLDTAPEGETIFCLESTAGAGTTIGRSFAELAHIMELVEDPARIGVCLDTCHLFAAGYDIRTPGGYEATMKECNETVGLERVRVWHVNDSQGELGSRRDRHAHLGKGEIGRAAFGFLMQDPRFLTVPKILETPKEDQPIKMDKMNLAFLRRAAARPTAKKRTVKKAKRTTRRLTA